MEHREIVRGLSLGRLPRKTPARRLAAIMAADIVGFSAAMERDEEGMFAQVQELRRKVIEPKIAECSGRLIKTTGDGFLAEFASPIAATLEPTTRATSFTLLPFQ